MSSASCRLRRSSSSCSPSRFPPAASTVRSYSGPNPCCSCRVLRVRVARAATTTSATTTATAITIDTHVDIAVPSSLVETARLPTRRRGGETLRVQLRAHQLVDELRICLALRLAHHLTDEE